MGHIQLRAAWLASRLARRSINVSQLEDILVRQADKAASRQRGSWVMVSGPHVGLDDIALLVVELKHRIGVVACNYGVLKAVPVGNVGTVVPIVQIKIVQKRAAHQADFIGLANASARLSQ